MTWILQPSDDVARFAAVGGGKAKHLARLTQLGFEVPPFFCVASGAFEAFLKHNHLEAVTTAAEDLGERSRAIEEAFALASLPAAVEGALAAALAQLVPGDAFVAVRSSGLDEDSAENSFAGQFASYLFQRGIASVRESLKRCWASAFSERALHYRRERGLSLTGVQVGVVVQRMIDAESAGVAFSRNPVKLLDRKTVVVSSVWGLGEGLVSGELDADHFAVSREDDSIVSAIVDKEHAIRAAATGGVEKVRVVAEKRNAPSLDDAQVRLLANLCVRIERAFGAPQDIEWAFAGGRAYLLQARPITNLPPDGLFDPAVAGDEPILWDNSNIIESYSGVTSALTFSFVSRAYARVYEQFAEVLGVPPDVIVQNRVVFRNMLGLVRGRIYYNLINWYRLLTLFPGAGESREQMETMMGVKQGLTPEVAALFDRALVAPHYSFWRKLSVTFVTLYRFAVLRGIIDRFVADFARVYDASRAKDLGTLSLTQLVAHVQDVEERLLSRWQAPIINDTRCMVFFGALKRLTEKWVTEGQGAGALQNDLLCGQGDLESTEPTKMLMRIAKSIDSGDPDFRAWFVETPSTEAWRELSLGKRSKAVYEAFKAFLDRYGFRCVNELKLEELDLHDDPSFAVEAVASYVRSRAYSIEAMEKREAEIRDKSEAIVRAKLTGLRRWFFFWILGSARVAVRDRENLRFLRTKVFGLLRQGYVAIGKRLEGLRLLDTARDVFHLTTDEVTTFVEGRAASLDLRSLAAARSAEYARYRASPAPPDRFLTRGAAGAFMQHAALLIESDLLKGVGVSSDPDVLLGTACCPGIVEGTVRVVHGIADAQGLRGEILATERTDPGWVPLYPSCSGLLIERGSLLSHSAVVARELGLPTIVGISGGLMSKLQTGMRVRMDAGKGEVRILR
jgi:pyruvate,water dikinase